MGREIRSYCSSALTCLIITPLFDDGQSAASFERVICQIGDAGWNGYGTRKSRTVIEGSFTDSINAI